MTPEERAAYRLNAMRAEALDLLWSWFTIDAGARPVGQGEKTRKDPPPAQETSDGPSLPAAVSLILSTRDKPPVRFAPQTRDDLEVWTITTLIHCRKCLGLPILSRPAMPFVKRAA